MPQAQTLSITPCPSPANPERHAVSLPSGEVVGYGIDLTYARYWRDGWEARMDLRNPSSGPKPHQEGRDHWQRGWNRANVHEKQRERQARHGKAA